MLICTHSQCCLKEADKLLLIVSFIDVVLITSAPNSLFAFFFENRMATIKYLLKESSD